MTRFSNMPEATSSRNSGESNRTSTSVYSGGHEYYNYLKDMKNGTSAENSEYSAAFMMF
jgi:hypothetical protein